MKIDPKYKDANKNKEAIKMLPELITFPSFKTNILSAL